MMKNESAKTALAVVFVIAIAAAFWLILLSPKRDQANELKDQAATLTTELESAQAQANEALAAKKDYAADYAQLVQIGKAVPADAATPSLLVELEALGAVTHTNFHSISLGTGEGVEGGTEATSESGESDSLPPLGATTGPSGLLAMPYSLEFEGGFFEIADFIQGLDSLVETKNGEVDARGRLITVDSFELAPGAEGEGGSSALTAHLSVSTYVTPPGQGLTAGATSAGPATASYEE
jgi:Tfp pilus assembly protein PilO